jgi:hypothetical protein
MLSSLEEQSFVIGDVLKTVDELYAARIDTSHHGKQHIKKPKYVLIFVDEINRFLPKDRYMNKHSAYSFCSYYSTYLFSLWDVENIANCVCLLI